MDLVLPAVIGVMIVALVGAAVADAARGRRRHALVAPQPATIRRFVLVADESVPLTDLDTALATITTVDGEMRVTGDGLGLRRLAARWTGVRAESLVVPDDGTTGVVELGPTGGVIVSWNVRR